MFTVTLCQQRTDKPCKVQGIYSISSRYMKNEAAVNAVLVQASVLVRLSSLECQQNHHSQPAVLVCSISIPENIYIQCKICCRMEALHTVFW